MLDQSWYNCYKLTVKVASRLAQLVSKQLLGSTNKNSMHSDRLQLSLMCCRALQWFLKRMYWVRMSLFAAFGLLPLSPSQMPTCFPMSVDVHERPPSPDKLHPRCRVIWTLADQKSACVLWFYDEPKGGAAHENRLVVCICYHEFLFLQKEARPQSKQTLRQ